jgi:hypothetical protein
MTLLSIERLKNSLEGTGFKVKIERESEKSDVEEMMSESDSLRSSVHSEEMNNYCHSK